MTFCSSQTNKKFLILVRNKMMSLKQLSTTGEILFTTFSQNQNSALYLFFIIDICLFWLAARKHAALTAALVDRGRMVVFLTNFLPSRSLRLTDFGTNWSAGLRVLSFCPERVTVSVTLCSFTTFKSN